MDDAYFSPSSFFGSPGIFSGGGESGPAGSASNPDATNAFSPATLASSAPFSPDSLFQSILSEERPPEAMSVFGDMDGLFAPPSVPRDPRGDDIWKSVGFDAPSTSRLSAFTSAFSSSSLSSSLPTLSSSRLPDLSNGVLDDGESAATAASDRSSLFGDGPSFFPHIATFLDELDKTAPPPSFATIGAERASSFHTPLSQSLQPRPASPSHVRTSASSSPRLASRSVSSAPVAANENNVESGDWGGDWPCPRCNASASSLFAAVILIDAHVC